MHGDSATYRRVLGQYPTGVVVVSAFDNSGAVWGMTLGTFSSVSLDPPIVGFMPSSTSASWAELEATGTRFCINILAADQEDICRSVATRRHNKFEGIEVEFSPDGNPLIAGVLAYVDCQLLQKHLMGDHHVVFAQVRGMDLLRPGEPLLFLGGKYGRFVSGNVKTPVRVEPQFNLMANWLHLPSWSD
jgi:flavin reductase (DIM6/NTAB) family NADH-FMN oxidoreductase RutF